MSQPCPSTGPQSSSATSHLPPPEWSCLQEELGPPECLHRLVAAQAARIPNAVALTFAGRELRYAELEAWANQLAHQLVARGVGPEVRVGLVARRSPELVLGALAVLKAGGAYVPLDPNSPRERKAYVLADAGVKVVLTQPALSAELAGHGLEILELQPLESSPAPRGLAPHESAVGPENLAYVIYTSGSTGRPKGVLVPHRGVCNLARAQARAFGVEEGTRVLQFSSSAFDAAASELFVTLAAGGTLVLASEATLRPEVGLGTLLRERQVQVVTLPPSVLAVMPPEGLEGLRTVVSAGEALPAETAARWAVGRRLINAYGPTEVAVCATLGEWEGAPGRPPIGRPMAGRRAYVLDEALRPLPVGVEGELYVGGPGLARGYLGQAALTAECFVPDPFSGEPGARMYRTGDRVRWLPDGQLDFLGRRDTQVKLRGYRIEPGEVEAVLAEHPSVLTAAVVAREDTPGELRLVAYVVAREKPGPSAEALRVSLGERLPDFMVPAAFVSMEALPLNTSGKVDRRALPAPEAPQSSSAFVAPRTPTEGALARLWQEVLGLKQVGVHERFLDLGGHSLTAMRFLSRLRAQMGVSLSFRDLLRAATIEKLALLVDTRRQAQASRPSSSQ
jgi:amino acid adenylation domain-containing protein